MESRKCAGVPPDPANSSKMIAKKLQQTAKHVTKFSCRTQNLKIHLKENLVCKNCWDHSFQPGPQQQFITINHSKENCILGCITVNSKYQQ